MSDEHDDTPADGAAPQDLPPQPAMPEAVIIYPVLLAARDLRWVNEARTRLDGIVRLDTIPDEIPFTGDDADPLPYVQDLMARARAGEFGEIAAYVPPPAPPRPALPDLSARQFFQALALPPYGIITPAEALARIKTGTVPAALQTVLDGIPDSIDRFNAEMILAERTPTLQRRHPIVAAIAQSRSPAWSQDDIDAFWTFAASL